MAKVIKYIGRTTDFKGKTLWEIVGNLKDFGVGRIVIRNMFQRYKEPCFMKIVKVEAQPDDQDASKLVTKPPIQTQTIHKFQILPFFCARLILGIS